MSSYPNKPNNRMQKLLALNFNKILILRFSSVGDVIQCSSCLFFLKNKFPNSKIHWAVRSDLENLIKYNPNVDKTWVIERKKGFLGLLKLALQLKNENFDFVYDAHNNLRTFFLCLFLFPSVFIRRSKNRWRRFLLFYFKINTFGAQFIQEESFVAPLKEIGINYSGNAKSQLIIPPETQEKTLKLVPFNNYITLVPSAAWELKKWPLNHFKKLIELNPKLNFVILGGAADNFANDLINSQNSNRVLSLIGKLSLLESCAIVQNSKFVIGNDTGITHAADQMRVPLIQFIGPVLFGYPAKESSMVLEKQLSCRPCTKDGRGKCKNKTYKKCLVDISPEEVTQILNTKLESHGPIL